MFARGSRLLQYSFLSAKFVKPQSLTPLSPNNLARPVFATSHLFRHYVAPEFKPPAVGSDMRESYDQELVQVAQLLVDLTNADKVTTTQCNSLIRNFWNIKEYHKMFKESGPPPNSETYTMMKEAAERVNRSDWAEELSKKI